MNKQTNANKSKKTYFINGMHCASCETIIETEISELNGIEKVTASLKNNCVTVVAKSKKHLPHINELNSKFKELGYTFSTEAPKNTTVSRGDFVKIILIVLVFVTLFSYIEKSPVLMSFSITNTSSLPVFFMFGLVAGLSSCAALVGGILLSLSKQWNDSYKADNKYTPFILFNVGRLVSFAVLGGLLGLIGGALQISIGTTATVTLVVSLIMLLLGFQMLGVKFLNQFQLKLPKKFTKNISNTNNFSGKYMPFAAGVLTFFVPCGFTLIAQSTALVTGNFINSALMLLFFALGTLPILAIISFTSIKLHSNPKFSTKFNYFAGLLVVFFALYTLNSQLNVLGVTSLNDILKPNSEKFEKSFLSNKKDESEEIQYIQMEASKFDYYPKEINLKAGVPVVWEFYNHGVYGCAQAAYVHGLYPNVIYLEQGMNVIKFTPEKKGTYKLSCTMGMVDPVTINVY